MNKPVAIGCLIASIRLLMVLPIWYYLLYQILVRENANELMMFLFWVYIPATIILIVASEIVSVIIKHQDQQQQEIQPDLKSTAG